MKIMDDIYKEVYFDLYCKTCKYEKLNENNDPCNKCLGTGANMNSHKPICWEEKEK